VTGATGLYLYTVHKLIILQMTKRLIATCKKQTNLLSITHRKLGLLLKVVFGKTSQRQTREQFMVHSLGANHAWRPAPAHKRLVNV